MDGAFGKDASGKNAFFVEGSGKACFGPCITIRGPVSNQAIAACGELGLFLVTISAGFGYIFSPGDLDVFLGSCDLSRYKPSISVGKTRAEYDANGTKHHIPTEPSLRALSIAAALAVPDGLGTTPRLALFDPSGTLIASTSPILGDFFRGPSGVLVDQDVSDGVVRFIVPNPVGTGGYTLQELEGGSLIAAPAYAFGDPPVDEKLLACASSGRRRTRCARRSPPGRWRSRGSGAARSLPRRRRSAR